MDHRAVSIQVMRSLGLAPVQVNTGGKDPRPPYSPVTIKTQDHEQTFKAFVDNPGLNVGALFHGRLVDIDIDSKEQTLFAALDLFLPKTSLIWGRKSKPRSHRAYLLSEDFSREEYGSIARYLKALKVDGRTYSVEVRGGKAESGMFAVMPGSYRADIGEAVEWDKEPDLSVTPAQVSAYYLMKRLRLAMATAILAAYWPEGSRNDLSLALAGLLWRIRSSSLIAGGWDFEEDVPEEIFLLTGDDAAAIFHAVLDLSDPNTADRRARELNFLGTWRKLDTDPEAKVTGGRAYAALVGGDAGLDIVKRLYRLLSDNQDIEALEEISGRYAVWNPAGVCIDMALVAKGYPTPFMTKDQCANSLGDQKVAFGDKRVPVVNLIFNSKLVRRVTGLTFDPSTTERLVQGEFGLAVNTWRGFSVEPSPQRVLDEEIEPYLDYVNRVIACENSEMETWVHSWVASLLRYPGERPGTALVLIGVQGAGKTFLGEKVICGIIGESHSMQTSSIESLTDKFNAISNNRVFILCNEAVHNYQKTVAAKLKSIITDNSMVVEYKGLNSFKAPNKLRLMFTSNELGTPIFIDPSPHERRFTIQQVSPRRANDITYWEKFRAWTDSNLGKILRWYLQYDYDPKLITRPVATEAKHDIQRLSVEPEISWIVSKLGSSFPISERLHDHWWHAYHEGSITKTDKDNDTLRRDTWPDRILMSTLEKDFVEFVRARGRPIYSGSVSTVIKKVFPEGSIDPHGQIAVQYFDQRTNQVTRDRVRINNFPTREEIVAHLRAKLGPIAGKMIDESADENLAAQGPALSEEY